MHHCRKSQSTDALSDEVVRERALRYSAAMASLLFLLVLVASVLNVTRTRKLEILWPRWKQSRARPLWLGGCFLSVAVLAFVTHPNVTPPWLLHSLITCALIVGVMALVYGVGMRCETWDLLRQSQEERDRAYRSVDSRVRVEDGRSTYSDVPLSTGETRSIVGTHPDVSGVTPETTANEDELRIEQYYLDRVKQKEDIESTRKIRKNVTLILFILYVLVCTAWPRYNISGVSCQRGFFWEHHLLPFGVFYVTKLAELYFYTRDNTLDAQLPFFKFTLLFVTSFLNYSDGYQYSIGIVIADACKKNCHHAIAGILANTMACSFWGGVVLLQWVPFAYYGTHRDASFVILAKLTHMDALAQCINIPQERLCMWRTLSWLQFLAQDILQVIQQVFFVIYVKRNAFMEVSIAFSVICAIHALYDAVARIAEAGGFRMALREKLEEAWQWRAVLERRSDNTHGFVENNTQSLYDLECDFRIHAGHSMSLGVPELTEVWTKQATRKARQTQAWATLMPEEEALIAINARHVFNFVDLNGDGRVDEAEYVAYMLGGTLARGSLHHMHKLLASKPSTFLSDVIKLFKSLDYDKDGFITEMELEQYRQGTPELPSSFRHLSLNSSDIIRADVDQDGKLDFWEFTAVCLGRRRYEVEVLLYDISSGWDKAVGSLLTGRDVEAFHSSVLVYGKEYWYGGSIFEGDPRACESIFGAPFKTSRSLQLEPSSNAPGLFAVKLGYTLLTKAEFIDELSSPQMQGRFNGHEKYDLISNSCNHCTNEIVRILTGRELPGRILELQRAAEKHEMLQDIRTSLIALNGWFGGFALFAGGPQSFSAVAQIPTVEVEINHTVIITVNGQEVYGTLVKRDGAMCEVRYFDPVSGQMKTANIEASSLRVPSVHPIQNGEDTSA